MMKNDIFDGLVILEIANNHMGDVEHGIALIRTFAGIGRDYPFRFALKFQYRFLENFIRENYRDDERFRYIKRFRETALSDAQFAELRAAAKDDGFLLACTPFDETSVDRVVEEKFDLLKIASCSLADWPLIEKIGEVDLPIIFSTAGATATEIERMHVFFKHRRKHFAMLHCLGEYPTAPEKAAMNQLDCFRQRYPDAVVGYSGHEEPDDTTCATIAVAKGAVVFERHVGLPSETYANNAYSSTPAQFRRWLDALLRAKEICGSFDGFRPIGEKERADLHGLRRACYMKSDGKKGDVIAAEHLSLALPNLEGHLTARDLSKYAKITLKENLSAGKPVLLRSVEIVDYQDRIREYVRRVVAMLRENKIALPHMLDFELSHHYGLERFEKSGATILNCVNRDYCKKIVVVFPGQRHPMHFHKRKEETFQVLCGELYLDLGDGDRIYRPGDLILIRREHRHAFRSETGACFEEVSTRHYQDDSYYDDPSIMTNPDRKTCMSFWSSDYESEFDV